MTRYIIRVTRQTDIDAFAADVPNVAKVLRRVRMVVADLDEAQADRLRTDARVAFIEEDQPGHAGNDPTHTQTITNEWQLDRIDQRSLPLDGEYGYDYDGTGVRVYVIDSGIRGTHDEFAGRIGPGYSPLDPPYDDPYDTDDEHGTRVAGIAAGTTTGVAKGATICSARFAQHSGAGGSSEADALDCIDWIISEETTRGGPAVVNFSYSHNGSAIGAAFQDLIDMGIPVFKSAMNNGTEVPTTGASAYRDIVYVSGTESDDSWAGYNYGARVDLLAPARDVWTADLSADDAYTTASGTSYAAPLTAGIAATRLETQPELAPWQLKILLQNQATQGAITGVPANTVNLLAYSRGEGWIEPERMQVHVGTVEIPASSGEQPIAWETDADWPEDAYPAAMIFLMIAPTVDPIEDREVYSNIRTGVGFASRDSSASHAISAQTSNFNNVNKRASTSAIQVIQTGTSTDLNNALIASWDVNGFTLDWQNVEMAYPQKLTYIALSGVEARTVAWQYPAATGLFSVDGVGFQPDVVLHTFSGFENALGSNREVTWAGISFGAMADNSAQWAMATQIIPGRSPDLARAMSNELAISCATATIDGDEFNAGAFVSMDPDGFTLDLKATTEDRWGLSLCIKGGSWRVGTIEQPASAGVNSLSVPGMAPLGILMSSVMLPMTDMNQGSRADVLWHIGAAGRDDERTFAISGPDGDNTYQNRADAALGFVTQSTDFDPVLATVTVDGFRNDAIDLDWSDADNSGLVFGYIAFGNEAGDPPPTPTGLTATAIDYDKVLLTWDAVDDGDGDGS